MSAFTITQAYNKTAFSPGGINTVLLVDLAQWTAGGPPMDRQWTASGPPADRQWTASGPPADF
eukprot:CCRYP_017843-RA/>CCRYP_017843-RA protein AED:0.39 eAED:0.51 QI:321/0/0.5/1/0/0/2/0/62